MPGLASLLSRRTTNPRAGGAAAMRRNIVPGLPSTITRGPRFPRPPWGGKDGGQVNGYHTGGGVPHDHLPGSKYPVGWTPSTPIQGTGGGFGVGSRTPIRTRRQQQQQAYLTGAAPRGGPRGGQAGGVVGYQGGGRTMNPRAAGAAAMLRNRPRPSIRRLDESKPSPVPIPPTPGGWAAGGEIETDSYGKYTIARGSGAARPQKFRKNG